MTDLASPLLAGDRRALAKAITLVESTRDDHRREAEDLLDAVLPSAGGAMRIGVTGSPGVGKSTFINAFGKLLTDEGRRVAVLAVDPSSTSTGGSILGDKTRMTELAANADVFVRPSPSGGSLGGIAARTRDAILLCDAAGYDPIFVETVGVGQSETAVSTITDLFLLLVAPGGGDDLQGIKRGVMELADLVLVNKADGPLLDLANATAADYRLALHLVRPKRADQPTEVLACSSINAEGLSEVWDRLRGLHQHLIESGALAAMRRDQAVTQLRDEVRAALFDAAAADPTFASSLGDRETEVAAGRSSVTSAARRVIELAWRAP